MSENQNRGTRDFSQYDSMETAELERILRLDAEAPEGTESDTELILYVMEVLASRRNNTNITGNTAQQAWESFTQNYMPHDIHKSNIRRERKPAAPWVRRLIATAAVLALVIAIPVTANAFSWKQLWNTVATWAKETFSFVSSNNTNNIEPANSDNLKYVSLQDLLERNNRPYDMVPTWIPTGFILEKIQKDISPAQEIYRAFYLCESRELTIKIQSYIGTNPEKVEVGEALIEIYESGGIEYYIVSNNKLLQAVWTSGSYECYIAGDLSIDELKQMIDSIEKG